MSDLNEFLILLQAKLDEAKSKKNIDADIETLQNQIKKIKLQAEIDSKSIGTGQQTGKKIGDSINKGLALSLRDVKHTISETIKSFGKLSSFELSKLFNLNRSDVDTSVTKQVRDITKEIESLSTQVLKTNSNESWNGIINKIDSLYKVLNQFGKIRDTSSFKESIDLLNWFNNKKIFVGDKSEVLQNTGMTIKELNNQFRNLVTFTTSSKGSLKLDTIWEELTNISPGLEKFTAFGDQIKAVVDHFQTAKEALKGSGGLIPASDTGEASKVLVDYIISLENVAKKLSVLREEQAEIEQMIANGSTVSTDKIVQNEQKKQQAYRETAQEIKNATGDYEKAINAVSSSAIGKYFKIDASTSAQFKAEMEKLVSEWTDAKGKLTDIKIDTRTTFDKDTEENIERLHQATVTYKNELNEVIKKTIAWRQIGTTINNSGQVEALNGFVEVAGQYSKSLDAATAKTDTFVKKQNKMVASLQNTINQITSRAFDQNSSKPITSDNSLAKLNIQAAYVENAMYDLRNATAVTFDDAVIKVRNEISELKILESELRKADNVSTKMKGVDIASGLSIARNDLEKFKADAKDFPQIAKTILELDTAISKVGDASSLNAFNDQLRVARSELSKIKSETTAVNRDEKVGINVSGLQSKIADLQRISLEIDKFKAKINGADVTVQSLYNDLAKVTTQSDFSVVNSKFKAFTDTAKSAGIAVTEVKEKSVSMFATLKKNLSFLQYWVSPMYLIMQAIGKIKQAFSELKSVNSIMTEISKVTEMTSVQLKKLGSEAYEAASKYGRTISDYLTGVQEMSRAGFQENQAKEMAELSVLAQAAGDISAELSNEYLIATNAAYKLSGEVSKLNDVLDGQNYVANRNAVSMEHLANATKVVASQAASSGVAVNEMTAAVGTMVATTQQSGDVAGRAFKAILMNLQQVSGEMDDGEIIDEESLTKYEKACNDLGVSLKTVKDGVVSLREPMEILKELAEAYTSLDEMDARRANLISAIGGKQRGNQLNALLENWSTYEKMLTDYSQGAGSAMNEAMKSANNWEGSLNRLHNTWVNTVENLANSDAIITIINGTNSLLNVLNKLTSKLGSIGSIGVGAFAITNLGRSNDFALHGGDSMQQVLKSAKV